MQTRQSGPFMTRYLLQHVTQAGIISFFLLSKKKQRNLLIKFKTALNVVNKEAMAKTSQDKNEWRELLQTLNRHTSSSKFWKVVRSLNGRLVLHIAGLFSRPVDIANASNVQNTKLKTSSSVKSQRATKRKAVKTSVKYHYVLPPRKLEHIKPAKPSEA